MKKEISKGTQKFILLMTAVIVVFVLALTAIIKFAPDSVRTTFYDEPQQTVSSQQSEDTDFDSVKERVDEANNTIGKEIYSLYSGEGASVLQRQAESRLFFSNLKNLLICILLVVVLIVLCKKGFDFKKIKRMLVEEEPSSAQTEPEQETTQAARKEEQADKEEQAKSVPTADVEEEPPAEEPPLEAEPPLKEEPESEEASEDEKQVAENCRL